MPQTFTVSFSRAGAIVFILVAIPVLTVAVFLTGIMALAGKAPEWVVIAVIILMMATAIGGVLLILKKWGTPEAHVRMDDSGITIRLLRRSPFYSRSGYASPWEEIENVSTNIDTQHNRRFYQLSFREPLATTVSLSPPDVVDENTETPFGEALLSHVARFNNAHSQQPGALIKRKGFYNTGWAKALTILAYAMMVALIAMKILKPETVDTWRIVQVAAFSVMWLASYHANNRRHPKV